MKTYISDIIGETEIAKWQTNHHILIHSQTGTGKTKFITTRLQDYCQKNNKKILLFSNRDALKEQTKKEVGETNVITLKNYQQAEQSIRSLQAVFEGYDYIILDECHYLFSDASFNRYTDILLDTLYHDFSKVFIYISATPYVLFEFEPKPNFDFQYSTGADYSYIGDIFFFRNTKSVENIIATVPAGEKAIYLGPIDDCLELSLKIKDSAFICSEHNKKYSKLSNTNVLKEISETEQFSCSFLATTKVLDNGINLKDDKLKHIIIDEIDPITLVQFLGRKRIAEGNEINLYVRNYHNGFVKHFLSTVNRRIATVKKVNTIGKEEFLARNKRSYFDRVIYSDGTVNMALYYDAVYKQKAYQQMIDHGYSNYICELLGVKLYKDYEVSQENSLLTKLLKDYSGKKLFGKEKEEFKKLFFENIFAPKNTNYRKQGFASINAILGEVKIEYRVISKRERNNGKREQYWMVV